MVFKELSNNSADSELLIVRDTEQSLGDHVCLCDVAEFYPAEKVSLLTLRSPHEGVER